ncbi:MAG: DNA translocase FtsK 4TM domain-containing protein [Patescibacteria group bacterium]
MAKKIDKQNSRSDPKHRLHPDAKKSILGVILIGVAIILSLAGINQAGPAGEALYKGLALLFGWGYFLLPLSFFVIGLTLLSREHQPVVLMSAIGGILFLLSSLALLEIASPGHGGILGFILGSLRGPFGNVAATVINLVILTISSIVILNLPLRLKLPERQKIEPELKVTSPAVLGNEKPIIDPIITKADLRHEEKLKPEPEIKEGNTDVFIPKKGGLKKFKNYTPPPIELLNSQTEKPTTGDLRANANIIKRTLESFGIAVEMGEINIGPKVTRYTLKPAEGVKLSRITALSQDLALSLAAHPIRIEAPIPGKSLVGIEIPNKVAAMVRLGSLVGYPDFQKSGPISFALGRDVTGEPIFGNIATMPHLLIAGATGSGKSVVLQSLITSLLYKNSPDDLRMVMIDPKRVELSIYEGIPHLVGPVITENKKALSVFRWAVNEMDNRYNLLLKASCRDIKSYNNKTEDEKLPYIVIIIDEVADLMTTYGREVEGFIIRLAQMARATGIHLVLSTQRPSVEIITGLIKANITTRIALQVASQIDSRTILDTGGAEKLLGGGDLLLISSEYSRPKRIQGTYISEEELHKVANFIRDNNEEAEDTTAPFEGNAEGDEKKGDVFDDFNGDGDDELYNEAVLIVKEAGKASASLLQRRLKVGYARAARLLDIMEGNNLIGPGDGAKPREIFVDKFDDSPREGYGLPRSKAGEAGSFG